jgi:hypothetical protein
MSGFALILIVQLSGGVLAAAELTASPKVEEPAVSGVPVR